MRGAIMTWGAVAGGVAGAVLPSLLGGGGGGSGYDDPFLGQPIQKY